MNNNLFDVVLAIEQSLKLLSKSTDNHKLLKHFADEADSFQQYLVGQNSRKRGKKAKSK